MVAAGLAALGLGVASYGAVGRPFSQGRLRMEMVRLDTPTGFTVAPEEVGGDPLCFDTCRERARSWPVPAGTATEAGDTFARSLRADGYSVSTGDGGAFRDVRRGRVDAHVAISTPAEAATWPLTVAPGHFVVRLTLFAG